MMISPLSHSTITAIGITVLLVGSD
jgi:hypothetical protein